ncbi:hypothetical protein ACFXHA_32835 [Nocardia sp. NPDC059240]|uniref:hypothetical protein n=1 Tax=Nocardia sp. NPDC059240 TaxID=3346786 RepID=UPI0036B49B48
MAQQRLKRSQLGMLQRLAEGGQGVVYHAPNASMQYANSLVYKEYKPNVLPSLDVAALEAMPDYLESLPFSDGFDLLSRAAWPCRLVEDDTSSTVIGFVMPAIPGEFFIGMTVSSGLKSATAQFQHLLNDDSVLVRRNIPLTDRHRYELLSHAAESLTVLHRRQIAIGDLSPMNLLFSLHPHRRTYIIDCDAMRLGSRSVSTQVETPDWEVHTANPGETLATPQSDAYKFGLLALRLFAGDQTTRDPDHLPAYVPSALRRLTEAALSAAPAQRPTPADWLPALADATRTASTHPPQSATTTTQTLWQTTIVQPAPGRPTPPPMPYPMPPTPFPVPRTAAPKTPRTRWGRLGVVAVVVAVAAGCFLWFDRGGSGGHSTPVIAGSHPASTCANPPKLSVAGATPAGDALDLAMDIVSACPDGDVLSASRTHITVSTSAGTVASAIFDLSTSPTTVPSPPASARRVFRFPAGQFWQPAETLSSPTDLRVDIDRSGSTGGANTAVTATGAVVTAAPVSAEATDPEAMALAGLQATAAADRPTVLRDIADRWVPQLSSKRLDIFAEGITWHHADILREHLELRRRFPTARLLWSGAWSTFSAPDFWITVAGVAFPTSDGAIGWCAANGFDRDHCYAKLVSTTHPIDGSTRYQS